MNSIPLQYESLKAVLLHMDPNVRFQIAQRLPSIRAAEKLVPLRIQKLHLDEVSTGVNDTTYTMGVYRDYEPGTKVPRIVKMTNDCSGVAHDLDEYGFEIYTNHLDSGDISFRRNNEQPPFHFPNDTADVEKLYQEELKVYEKALYLRTGRSANGEAPEEPDTNGEWQRLNEVRSRGAMTMSIDILGTFIDDARTNLLPFECRRFDRKPAYTAFIQLTVFDKKTKSRRIQRYQYNMKLYEAVKKLNELLFGGRRSIIQTHCLQLPRFGNVLRLPVGFKVKTKQLENVRGLVAWNEAVNLMLDTSCFPLDIVEFSISGAGDGLQFPTIRNAKKLITNNYSLQFDILPILATLTNKEVVLNYTRDEVSVNGLFGLIQNWLDNDRPIGTCYSFGIQQENTAKSLFEMIKSRVENTKRTKRCLSIITKSNSRLEVFYVPIKTPRSQEHVGFMYDCKWILKIRIVRF